MKAQMKFEVDKQTLKDLEIFDMVKNEKSVFSLFNFTQCIGGRKKLFGFLYSPLTNVNDINVRKSAIEFFQTNIPSGLNVDKDSLDFAEYYLRHADYPIRPPALVSAVLRKMIERINPRHDYYIIERGVNSIVSLLKTIYEFSKILTIKLSESNKSAILLQKRTEKVLQLFSQAEYGDIIKSAKIRAYDISKYDYMFRFTHKIEIEYFLELIYEYDAFLSIAKASQVHGFSYPEVVSSKENILEATGIFHPFVEKAVPNNINFERTSNLLFVSGPNMAGKSTFLKALGISVYLAHAGFPVPTSNMRLSVLSGLCTTINISDNLSSGYSHFYAEVMRIKDVAERLINKNNMLVIFDELFRGTNVKDAYDGTLAVVSAFSNIDTSFFVVSSHIVEVANELKTNNTIQFSYFEVIEEEGHPAYTYKMREGVSDVRLGMYIIKKERLIELINNINTN